MAAADTFEAVKITENTSDPSKYIREKGKTGFDAAAFHYSIYRGLKRFLGYEPSLFWPWKLADSRSKYGWPY